MKPEIEKKIDEIMYETNNKINAIVDEIRQIKFSKMNEEEKRLKCDKLREEFGKVMIDEEKRIEEIMNFAS
jgi:hypothetical protein